MNLSVYYQSKTYQLNSLRLGLIHEDNIHGKPTIFVAMESQAPDVSNKVKKYINLQESGDYNIIMLPVNLNDHEPGDNYEIYTYYENVLGIKFYVTEKISIDHVFFKDFGIPEKNFTEYHFDAKTKFVRKS